MFIITLLLQYMLSNNIQVVDIPAYCSHIVQPLDNVPFACFKRSWEKHLDNWNFQHLGALLNNSTFFTVFFTFVFSFCCCVDSMFWSTTSILVGFFWNVNGPLTTEPFLQYMLSNNIQLIAISAHCLHNVQLLDNVPFACFKRSWEKNLPLSHLKLNGSHQVPLRWISLGNKGFSPIVVVWLPLQIDMLLH